VCESHSLLFIVCNLSFVVCSGRKKVSESLGLGLNFNPAGKPRMCSTHFYKFRCRHQRKADGSMA
jgi:hypothetical protein